MPTLGNDVDFTGYAGTLNNNVSGATSYGNLKLASGMTVSGSQALAFRGRGSQNFTTQGLSIPSSINIVAPTGTYTIIGNLITTSTLTITIGTLDAATNNVNVTCSTFVCTQTSTYARTLNMGTGTWTLTSTAAGTFWNITTSGMTLSGTNATIIMNAASANIRTFGGGNQAYGIFTYNVSSSSGAAAITGANSFRNINIGDGNTISFPASTTTTINNFTSLGTSGTNAIVNSSTPGTQTTLAYAGLGQIVCNYVTAQDINATPANRWFIGQNSTSVSNNTGLIFTSQTQPDQMALLGTGL